MLILSAVKATAPAFHVCVPDRMGVETVTVPALIVWPSVNMFACPSRVAFTAVVSSVSVILLPLLPESAEMSSTGNKSPLAMVECVKAAALEIGRSDIKIIQLK